jgi:thiol-disulfide isomerase/thioredoxin
MQLMPTIRHRSSGALWRAFMVTLALLCSGVLAPAYAQIPTEGIVEVLRERMGEQCKFQSEDGKAMSIESVAEKTLSAAMSGQQIRYKPITVTNGVKYLMMVPSKTVRAGAFNNRDDVDFAAKSVAFAKADGTTLTSEEAKTLLEGNAELIASPYNVVDGVISEYRLAPRPKPSAIRFNAGTGKQEVLDSNDPKVQAMLKQKSSTAIDQPADESKRDMSRLLSAPPALKTDATMPDFDVTDIAGKRWRMSELRGKTLVLNFWFVECAPCVQEMPALNALVKAYRNNPDVVFLSFTSSDAAKVKTFLGKKAFDYAHIPEEQSLKLLTAWGVTAFPLNTVVHRGKIVASMIGGSNAVHEQPQEHPMYGRLDAVLKDCLKN